MATLTIIVPDDIPVMDLFNFAHDHGLRPYWRNADTVEMRRESRKVVPMRERIVGFHGDRVIVDDPNPEPPRAA